MKYNFKKNLIINEDSPKILGHGYQGTVFEFGDSAFKTYNLSAKRKCDDRDVAIRLSKLDLKHFVTPYSLKINSKGNLSGFRMRLLNRKSKEKLTNMDICDAIRDMKEIRQETRTISENRIIFNDLQPHNVIITGKGIEIYDFSAYGISDSPHIIDMNNTEIDTLFGSLLLISEMPDVDPIFLYNLIYANYKKSGCSTIEEYYEKVITNGSIGQYVLKKVKK